VYIVSFSVNSTLSSIFPLYPPYFREAYLQWCYQLFLPFPPLSWFYLVFFYRGRDGVVMFVSWPFPALVGVFSRRVCTVPRRVLSSGSSKAPSVLVPIDGLVFFSCPSDRLSPVSRFPLFNVLFALSCRVLFLTPRPCCLGLLLFYVLQVRALLAFDFQKALLSKTFLFSKILFCRIPLSGSYHDDVDDLIFFFSFP